LLRPREHLRRDVDADERPHLRPEKLEDAPGAAGEVDRVRVGVIGIKAIDQSAQERLLDFPDDRIVSALAVDIGFVSLNLRRILIRFAVGFAFGCNGVGGH
jgi:hypothetical protein